MMLSRPRLLWLFLVILAISVPYAIHLGMHYAASFSSDYKSYETGVYAHNGKPGTTVVVAFIRPKAMYLGGSYYVSADFHLEGIPDYTSPKRKLGITNGDVFRNAHCGVTAPDFTVASIGACQYLVSPKIAGSPMLVLHVEWSEAFEVYEGGLTRYERLRIVPRDLAVTAPVEERLSLMVLSAPLAIIVALAGLFFKGGGKEEDDATQRLLTQIAKKRKT
jgi:hypothetical protein